LLSVTNTDKQGTRNTYYVTYDANGNVSEYIDSSGNTVAHYEYSPYGKLTASQGSKAADFNHRFSTKYRDAATELYYYGFRYYSSELGRWLSRDPIGLNGGINLYGFVNNRPIFDIDPMGLTDFGMGIQAEFTFGSSGITLKSVGVSASARQYAGDSAALQADLLARVYNEGLGTRPEAPRQKYQYDVSAHVRAIFGKNAGGGADMPVYPLNYRGLSPIIKFNYGWRSAIC